jgi:hypothetical protein
MPLPAVIRVDSRTPGFVQKQGKPLIGAVDVLSGSLVGGQFYEEAHVN